MLEVGIQARKGSEASHPEPGIADEAKDLILILIYITMSKKVSFPEPQGVGFSYMEIAHLLSLMTKELHYIEWFSRYLPDQADRQYMESMRSSYTKMANLVPAHEVDRFLEAFPYLHEAFGVAYYPEDDEDQL